MPEDRLIDAKVAGAHRQRLSARSSRSRSQGREKTRARQCCAGLTQFGVNLTRLKPGAASSLRHWHEKEDEFVYVLEGELVLIEDGGETHPEARRRRRLEGRRCQRPSSRQHARRATPSISRSARARRASARIIRTSISICSIRDDDGKPSAFSRSQIQASLYA